MLCVCVDCVCCVFVGWCVFVVCVDVCVCLPDEVIQLSRENSKDSFI